MRTTRASATFVAAGLAAILALTACGSDKADGVPTHSGVSIVRGLAAS